MLRVGVLASGSGTNFQALFDACATGYADATIALVVTDRAEAGVIKRAHGLGVDIAVVLREGMSQEEHERLVSGELRKRGIELVCCAGYMRILGPDLVKEFEDRILNVHPSLLPSFPGLRAIEQAVNWGVKTSGATIHIVDVDLDSGPIVVQKSVDIQPLETLEQRIHLAEYEIYPQALALFARGAVKVIGRVAEISENIDPPTWAGSLPPGLQNS